MENKSKQFSNVFIFASVIVGLLVIIGAIFPNQFGSISGAIGSFITETFGWYYMLLISIILIFCITLIDFLYTIKIPHQPCLRYH